MTQFQTPLYNALLHHQQKDPISYHVPGHKYGTVFPDTEFGDFTRFLQLDVTELTGLDDLHQPEGVIAEAKELTSALYGTMESFFLVNGSTVGNLAMILATCTENDTVLVQRNSHKSIINGLQMAGVQPVFLKPEYDQTVKVATGISTSTVREAILRYPNAKAIILTNPNYYGHTVNLRQIIEMSHNANIPVLVDEAHGAHFILDGFPESAITLGADIVVHSAHKTLPAMTMGSFLHFNSKIVGIDRLKWYLQVLQSSSPSYPIMASLDLARYYLATLRANGTYPILKEIQSFKEELNEISQIKIVTPTSLSIETDPLKITIQTNINLNGYQVQSLLEDKGVYTELADPNNILLIMPLKDKQEGNNHYTAKILREQLKVYTPEEKWIEIKIDEGSKITELPISYKQIKRYNEKVMSFNEVIGKISAEMIIPYPPGIPVLMVGELITPLHIENITSYLQSGARFQGNNLINKTIKVFDL